MKDAKKLFQMINVERLRDEEKRRDVTDQNGPQMHRLRPEEFDFFETSEIDF